MCAAVLSGFQVEGKIFNQVTVICYFIFYFCCIKQTKRVQIGFHLVPRTCSGAKLKETKKQPLKLSAQNKVSFCNIVSFSNHFIIKLSKVTDIKSFIF